MKKIEDAIGVRISCDTVDVNVFAYLSALSLLYLSMCIIFDATFYVESLIKMATAGSPKYDYFCTRMVKSRCQKTLTRLLLEFYPAFSSAVICLSHDFLFVNHLRSGFGER